jgi:hypothetical protein
MRRFSVRGAVAGALIACMAVSVPAADVGRVLRSSVFPGMGQLGDDQTGRGLLYMAGEIALLSLTVDQIVRKAAADRSTEYYKVKVANEPNFERMKELEAEWDQAVEDSERAQLLTYVFAGTSLLWWAWNIVDAIVFAPRENEGALMHTIRENTVVAVGLDKAQLAYKINF